MPMNFMHRRICSSEKWAGMVAEVLPLKLAGLDLGDKVLEVGPGYGATTRVLAEHTGRLTALEVDKVSARRLGEELDEEFGGRVDVVHGDGAAMPFEDDTFSAVVCFTMLHHVPTPGLQDRLFAEALRVLRPAGMLRGADSQPSLRFRLLHIGDTMTVVDPLTLPERLAAAGFTDVWVEHEPKQRVDFSARKPERSA